MKMKCLLEKLAFVSVAVGLAFFLNPKPVMADHCGFLDPTCSHDGCNDLDATCNPNAKRITKPISEQLWGEAGANAYQAAASIMRGRHGGSVGLDDIQKRYLRPHYGSLVDQVVVVYSARMMSEWSALGKNISLGGVDSAAQTYCNRIYVKDSYQSGNRDQLLLLAHELRHAQQCQESGGEGKFGYHYFREYKRAGQNYENNSLEKSADERANSIASSVPNQLLDVSGFQIVSSGGLCLDAKDYGQSRVGNPLQLYTCNSDPAQKWNFTSNGQIVSSGGLCLDAKDYGQSRVGNPLQLYTCNSDPAQKWDFASNTRIVSSGSLCLDAKDYGQSRVGNPLQLYTCNGEQAQTFSRR
jgi:hypothetical protein